MAGVTVVAVVAAVAILLVINAGDDPAQGQSTKPDITKLNTDMALPESTFPSLPEGVYTSYPVDVGDPPLSYKVQPPECAFIGTGPNAKQQVTTVVKSNARIPAKLTMLLYITDERVDINSLKTDCMGELMLTGKSGSKTVDVRPVDAAGVPSWALSYEVSGGGRDLAQYVAGYYRGVLVVGIYTTKDSKVDAQRTGDVVKLYNAQVERLEAQP